MARLEGRTALVTGAASGIGAQTAKTLAREGARVAVADIQEKQSEQVVNEIEQHGHQALAVRCNVQEEADLEDAVDATVDAFGSLDVAVNNAGIEGELAATAEHPTDAFDRVVSINLRGVFLGMKHEIPVLLDNGGGSIVNVASVLGKVAFPTTPAYTASKHGVLGLTKTAALEYAEEDVRVNAVCPGWIQTPMVMERGVHAGEHEDTRRELESMHAMNRLGDAQEIADAVAYLASDEASFVTGHALSADGGYTAR